MPLSVFLIIYVATVATTPTGKHFLTRIGKSMKRVSRQKTFTRRCIFIEIWVIPFFIIRATSTIS